MCVCVCVLAFAEARSAEDLAVYPGRLLCVFVVVVVVMCYPLLLFDGIAVFYCIPAVFRISSHSGLNHGEQLESFKARISTYTV